MPRRLLWLGGLLCLPLLWLLLAGCSSSSDPVSGPAGTAYPPIHVALTRAGVAYAPAQLRHAYGFDQVAGTGVGQTIAIVDAYGSPTIQKDLNTFCANFGIPTTTITIAYPNGKPSRTDSGWALETALDVEWAHAIAPGAKILLVVGRSASLSYLLAAVDYASARAAQVSMSWGAGDFNGDNFYDYHFNKTGVTFLASSGDSGSGVLWPASSPYVVGVGGTTLTLDVNNTRISEVAWSGSGGGQSTVELEPSYQNVWQTTGHRQVPDVSYDADPNTGMLVYDSTSYFGQRGWFIVGGTSAGAPQWAALVALVNAGRATRLTATNTPLYSLGSPANQTTNFFDIVSGSNGSFTASAGYDMVTGLGSPLANTLIPHLTAY